MCSRVGSKVCEVAADEAQEAGSAVMALERLPTAQPGAQAERLGWCEQGDAGEQRTEPSISSARIARLPCLAVADRFVAGGCQVKREERELVRSSGAVFLLLLLYMYTVRGKRVL